MRVVRSASVEFKRYWAVTRHCQWQLRCRCRWWICGCTMPFWKRVRPRGVTWPCHRLTGARRRAMSKDVPTALTDCLTTLRLSTVRSQYEEVSRQATAESWGYVEFLL